MKQKYLSLLLSVVLLSTTFVAPIVSAQAGQPINVFAHDDNSIYVNWQDTTTATSKFEVQRLQVTPKTDINFTAVRSGSTVNLKWTNPTTGTPYHTILERSVNSNFSASATLSNVA